MQNHRSYRSNSLSEGANILNSEWSRHRLSVPRGDELRLRFSIRSITPDLSLSTLAYGAPATVRPEDRAEVLLLQMPRMGSGLVSHGAVNAPMDSNHYALIDVRRVAQVQCSAELEVLVLRIGIPRAMAWLEEALGRRPAQDLVFDPVMARGSPSWAAWAPVAAALDTLQRSTLEDFPAPAMQAMENMVLSTLLMAQPNNYREALLRPAPSIAPRHVRRAEAFIHANLSQALDTTRIAQHAGVSVRALFDGFRAFRQTTPAAYVREARLASARDALLRGADSIAIVAQRFGFAHPGHFAAQYRRQFGESPTDTHRLRSQLH